MNRDELWMKRMKVLRLRLVVPAILLVLFAPVWGQENTSGARGWLRILPVGDAPPFRQEIRGGVRQELDTPEGSLPPRELVVPVRKEKDENENEGKVRLTLGQVSEAVLVGAGPLVLSDAKNADDPAGWTKIMMPERSSALAVMFRDPRGSSWESVLGIVVGDDIASFPVGRIRFVNATPFTASVLFQGKSTVLKPGQVMLKQPAAGEVLKNEAMLVAVRDSKGKTSRIFDSVISQSRGERTNVIIHWSDGESPRRPARVLLRSERPVLRKLPNR